MLQMTCTNEKQALAHRLSVEKPSQYEARLWYRLSGRQLGRVFHRRRVVFGYIPAFWCQSLRLAIDLTDPAADRAFLQERDRWLADQGVTTIRFSKLEVFMSPNACIAAIRQWIASREVAC